MGYTDDALQDCTLETCIILLTNVTLINSIKKKITVAWTMNKSRDLLHTPKKTRKEKNFGVSTRLIG